MTGNMIRTPGRHVTRRLEEPRVTARLVRQPGPTAQALAETHNEAVRQYGSNGGGFHAFQVGKRQSAGTWAGTAHFPAGTVVTRLVWGYIDPELAQRLLTGDGWNEEA